MRTVFAEYNVYRNSIDIYPHTGYMLRIDCDKAEDGIKTCELPEIFRLKFAPQPQLWCILVYSVVSLSVSSTFRKSIISS